MPSKLDGQFILLGFCIFSWEKIGNVISPLKTLLSASLTRMDDLVSITYWQSGEVKDLTWSLTAGLRKVLHECIDVVNAGLALVHRCQDLDVSCRDLTAGSQK